MSNNLELLSKEESENLLLKSRDKNKQVSKVNMEYYSENGELNKTDALSSKNQKGEEGFIFKKPFIDEIGNGSGDYFDREQSIFIPKKSVENFEHIGNEKFLSTKEKIREFMKSKNSIKTPRIS